MCITSPLPQVVARLLQFYREWALVTENWFILELIAVLLALHEFSGHPHQVVLLILSDNTTTVSYLTKQGGTHSALQTGL